MSDYVNLEDVVVPVRVGTNTQEREVAQPIEFQIKIKVDAEAAAQSDAIEDTFNYVDAYNCVVKTAQSGKYHLLEYLCGKIAEAILQTGGESVWIKASKIRCPIPGMQGRVSVELMRKSKSKI